MVCRVLVRETTTLPSNSGVLVPISIPEAEHLTKLGLVEPCTENTVIYAVPGILDLQRDKFYINVLNTSPNSITLHANQQLGTCASYDDLLVNESIRATSLISDDYSSPGTDTVPSHLQDLLERSSEHLNNDQIASLQNLLLKYKNVFSESSEDIGRTNLTKHKINTGTALPIRQPCRRLPIGKRDIEKEELNKMIDRGIIEPSSSPWAANIVLVLKKDGKTRFCVDYRQLNDVTIKDAYPLPRVDECLDSLSNSKWFSSMDLNSGFWQIAMAPEDKEKTAFNTSLGLYQFTVMPFGLANSPSTFERLMENILRGLQWQECLVYMDDIIVPGQSFSESLETLDHIFQRLSSANLKLKPSKCTLFQKEIKVLGHLVSESGISTDPQNQKQNQCDGRLASTIISKGNEEFHRVMLLSQEICQRICKNSKTTSCTVRKEY